MAKNISKRNNMSAQNRPFSLKATKKTQKVNLQTTIVDGKKVRKYVKMFDTGQLKSLDKVGVMVEKNGGKYFRTLSEVAEFLNNN